MSLSFVRRIAIAALALPLLLGGCTDDEPDPDVPETSSPSTPTTETSAAAPVEPTLPPEAEGKGPKAAEAFVRHYYDSVDYAQQTGDTKHLRSLGCADVRSMQWRRRRDRPNRWRRRHHRRRRLHGHPSESHGSSDGPRQRGSSCPRSPSRARSRPFRGTNELDGTYGGAATRLRFEIANSDVGFQSQGGPSNEGHSPRRPALLGAASGTALSDTTATASRPSPSH